MYLGNEENAKDLETLKALQITYVLNTACDSANFFPENFTYHNLNVCHDDSKQLKDYPKLFRFCLILRRQVSRQRQHINEVPVHCLQLADETTTPLRDALEKGVCILRDNEQGGARTFVHCVVGASRSASVVIAYGKLLAMWLCMNRCGLCMPGRCTKRGLPSRL